MPRLAHRSQGNICSATKNVFRILRPFLRHHPINFSSAEITAKVLTKVSRLETMANNAMGRSTPAQSKKNIEVVLRLLSHLQIDNMGDDLFALMAERTVPTMRSASPNLPEEADAIPHDELADFYRSASADLMTSNAQLYLQRATQDETADLNNFYSTTIGKKMLTVLSMLMQQSLFWGIGLDKGRDLRQPRRERLKQEGYNKE